MFHFSNASECNQSLRMPNNFNFDEEKKNGNKEEDGRDLKKNRQDIVMRARKPKIDLTYRAHINSICMVLSCLSND